jgi:RNA polymerase sigma-70 factor (TIGR02960 family)
VRRYSSIGVVVIRVETPRNPESDRSPSPTLGVITDVETQTLALARAGDGAAFGELVEPYRRELQLHCYRILGSLQDAQDVLQETLLAAWRGLEGFQERASVRAWLYRIATNRCLNALRDRGRRPPVRQPMAEPPEPTRRAEPIWLQPYPDALLADLPTTAPGPDARYETTETVGLAFVAALQHLPPRQRVVLVLRDVLGFTRTEAAAMLGTSEAAVKAGLQRARATLEANRPTRPASARELAVVGRFAGALENGDIDALVSLLTDDAWLTMPPEPYEYQGPAAIAGFLRFRASLLGGRLRLVPTWANGQPAFGCYLPEEGYGLLVLAVEGSLVSAMTWFGDRSLFQHFGLPVVYSPP